MPATPLTMRYALFCTMMSLAAPTGATTGTRSISLSQFVPRVDNLPTACDVVYKTSIDGCENSDFPNERDPNVNSCSAKCVEGLVQIVSLVEEGCAGVRVPANSIIGVALLGNLVPELCGNIVVVTEQPGSTQAPSPSTLSTSAEASSTQEAQSTSTQQDQSSSAQATDTASSASSSITVTTTADTISQTIELASPANTGQPQLTLDTDNPPPAPSQTTANQKSNPDSGGGSPFDITFSAPASHVRIGGLAMTAILGVAAYSVAFL